MVQRAEQEQIVSVTLVEGAAEVATIITSTMEQTGNAFLEVRRINATKEIRRRLILNIVNPVRMIVFVL